MPLSFRIALLTGLLIFSAGYGLLTATSDELARTLAVGYIAIVLTIIFLLDTWKRKDPNGD